MVSLDIICLDTYLKSCAGHPSRVASRLVDGEYTPPQLSVTSTSNKVLLREYLGLRPATPFTLTLDSKVHCKNFSKRYAWLSETFLAFISFEQVAGKNGFRP